MTRRAVGKKPGKDELIRLYEKEGRTIRDIADILGCSKDMVFRTMKEYGVLMRSNARRSRLIRFDIDYLESGIKEKGLRGFAKILKIDNSTLLHHIKT